MRPISGPQDLVVVAVKQPAMATVARGIAPLLAPHTMVLTAMNGVPWWFFQGFGGEHAGMRLESVDADGSIAAAIPASQVIGCVVHATASDARARSCAARLRPGADPRRAGRRHHASAPRWSRPLRHAGFEARASATIQLDIWYKLWGNMTMNPVPAITGATCDRILDDELVRAFCCA